MGPVGYVARHACTLVVEASVAITQTKQTVQLFIFASYDRCRFIQVSIRHNSPISPRSFGRVWVSGCEGTSAYRFKPAPAVARDYNL